MAETVGRQEGLPEAGCLLTPKKAQGSPGGGPGAQHSHLLRLAPGMRWPEAVRSRETEARREGAGLAWGSSSLGAQLCIPARLPESSGQCHSVWLLLPLTGEEGGGELRPVWLACLFQDLNSHLVIGVPALQFI